MKNTFKVWGIFLIALLITACEDPVLTAPEGQVPENATAGYHVTQVSISNTGNSVLKSIVLSGYGAKNFAIDNAGLVTVAENANLDFEADQSYILSVTATNTQNQSVQGDIIINITDIPDVTPTLFDFEANIAENLPAGTLIGSVQIKTSGDSPVTGFALSDANTFSINNEGNIYTNAPIDFEQVQRYQLGVYAINAAGSGEVASMNIDITNVADVLPRIMGFTTSIESSLPIGSVIGKVKIEEPGDSPISEFTISDSENFEIDLDGTVRTKTVLDFEASREYSMEATATNTAGSDKALILFDLVGNYTIAPFEAHYYIENDGTEAGVGTNGSDPSVIPVLQHSETVVRPAINYPWSNFHGIDSYNLYATWESTITINSPTVIQANFSLSWSDVSFYIDNTLHTKWKNSNKVLDLNLSVGTHTLRIEYHNHWHTTGFNVSFTDFQQSSVNIPITTKISDNAQINYLAAYSIATSSSGATYNEVIISLPQTDRPQVLFLSSYRAINWIIDNPYDTPIEAIVFDAYQPGSTINNYGKASVLYVPDLASYSEAATLGNTHTQLMTGRSYDYLYNDNYFKDILIPAF